MTSRKHQIFVFEQIASQRLEDVPGIGPVYARELAKYNITSALQLTELYYKTSSKAEFLSVYQSMTGANLHYSLMTYEGIREQAAVNGTLDYGRESYSNSTTNIKAYSSKTSATEDVIIKEDSSTTPAIQPIPTQVKLDQTKEINAFGSTTNSVDSTLVQNSTTSTSSQDTSDQKGNISMFTNAISSDFPKTSVNQDVDKIKKEVGMETQNASPTTFKQTSFNQDEEPTITSGNSQNTSTKQPAAKEDVSDQSKKKVGSGTQHATPIPSPKDTFNQNEKPIITSGDSQKTSTKQPGAKQDVLDQIKKEVGSGTQKNIGSGNTRF